MKTIHEYYDELVKCKIVSGRLNFSFTRPNANDDYGIIYIDHENGCEATLDYLILNNYGVVKIFIEIRQGLKINLRDTAGVDLSNTRLATPIDNFLKLLGNKQIDITWPD